MNVLKVMLDKKKYSEAKYVGIGHLAKHYSRSNVYVGLSYRVTEDMIVHLHNHCIMKVGECTDYYEDIGPFTVEIER